ncbi:unnamed protein product [Moneuplotes crassus]|uniref:Uncharacterized protein n=1 Tax=Euplotes crassus TaxID=5936 RepID=A0AAD1XG64_EUPCR|nr:unnamed protein product [Moneuplotes crassus]
MVLTEITISDLTINHSSQISVDELLSMDSYSKSETYRSLIVGTFISATNDITYYSYSLPKSTANFGIKIGCTTSCGTMRSAKAAIIEAYDLIAVGYINDNQVDALILIGLTNGTYAGDYKTRASGHQSINRNIVAIGQLADSDKLFMMSSFTGEYLIWIYDISSKFFARSYAESVEMTFMTAKFGYFLLATHESTQNDPYMYKIPFDDTFISAAVQISDPLMDTPGTPSITVVSTFTANSVTSDRTLSSLSISSTSNTEIQINQRNLVPLNTRNSSYQMINVPAGGKNTIDFTSPCLADASYTLSASIGTNQNDEGSPSWISLNDDYSAIIADAPEIEDSKNTFYIGIDFKYSSYVYTQFSTIKLFNCGISNCNGCEYDTKDGHCISCKDGYQLSQDGKSCTREVLPTETLAATTTAVIIASAGIGAMSSIASSGSGSSAIWAVMNQYQLYLLFPLLQSYLPAEFVFYLTEFELFNFDFNFLEKVKVPGLEYLASELNYKASNGIFEKNGISSGSFFVNQFQFFKAMVIIGTLNFLFIALYYLLPKLRNTWLKKLYKWLISFFYFSVYIRLILETFLFAFISCLLEFTTFSSFTKNSVSYLISVVFLLGFIGLPFLVYFHFKRYNTDGEVKETSKLAEFYEGYAKGKRNKLYVIIFLVRRIVTAFCLVCMRNTSVPMRCTIFFIIQFLYFQYLVFNMPFESKNDNIIEVLNESVFFVLSFIIAMFQEENDWKSWMSPALIMIIMVNGFVISGVICIGSCRLKQGGRKCKEW